ncbi:MAG: ATP-dependent RNA helicase HrpA [Proteobacteria bacterium]|nr:ATP-dependent RNA helicase HrpA [Pseudomonadota bacterium]
MLDSLSENLDKVAIADRYTIENKIRQLGKAGISADKKSQQAARLADAIKKSIATCEVRISAIPSEIIYPANLPITQKVEEIASLLQSHQTVVVAGDTGSGKTTQLPKICLEAGFGRLGLIGHTQPRRLAAVSVANRIAEELGVSPGQGVGYQVRFNNQQGPSTFLKLMTDGILLTEIQHDRFLNRYQVIIIDEAHERSLNIDFLLGFLKQLLNKRQDLKLIITSATIDVEKFSRHFNGAPIVAVSGRTYPVETRYAPLDVATNEQRNDDLQAEGIIKAINEIAAAEKNSTRGPGDVLVFLSSEREIRDTAATLRKQQLTNTELLPLYARLRYSEQVKIFKGHKGRRIVLATNVAETSLTVPGIRYVVDTGFARISRYSLQTKVQRLPIEAVSQASANQRKGRCGRLEDGICIRLFSEEDFNSRPPYTDPEIKRTNLASVILRMLYLRLGDVEAFPFIEPPEPQAIREGYKLLAELNALSHDRQLTATGKQMAALPVDPKHARMLVTAVSEHCLRELLIIVSVLSIQDPREIASDNRQAALQKLEQFAHPDSDFFSFVNLWDHFESQRQNLSQKQLRNFCKTHYLSFMRMREWREVHRQLLISCQQMGFRVSREPGSYESIHRSIIAGSLNQIARRVEGKTYLGNRNRKFSLFNSSVMKSGTAQWIVTGQLIETSQTFATMAARIEPQWVEQMALHLVKREHFEPHWSKKRQEVMAYEKVHLYGLVIIEKAPIRFAKIDPETAREIFIQDGLVAGQIEGKFQFLLDNQHFLEELAKQEEKMRRPEMLVSDRETQRFYESRIPAGISSTRQLQHWIRDEASDANELLTMSIAALGDANSLVTDIAAFPDKASLQHNDFQIDYLFDPGSVQDGATISVPITLMQQLQQADLDWAVPGIIREKCIALIKGLPKSLRKQFIPINIFVDEAMPQMSPADGTLIDSLLAQIRARKQLNLTRADFERVDIPAHLRIKVRLLNDEGEEVGFSANIDELKSSHRQSQASAEDGEASSNYGHDLEQTGVTDWVFGELPVQVEIGDELVLIRYPALVDHTDSIAIELLAVEEEARAKTRSGLVRLYMLRSVQQKNMLKKKFARLAQNLALLIPGQLSNMADDALYTSYAAAFDVDSVIPRTRSAFEEQLNKGRQELHEHSERIAKITNQVLEQRQQTSKQLRALDNAELAYLVADINLQMDNLIGENFLSQTPYSWLLEFPRYFEAIQLRLGKIPNVGPKDQSYTQELAEHWNRYGELCAELNMTRKFELQQLRWMIEEYRVSLFAQSLGTSIPVSAKRIDNQITQLKQ